MIIYKKFKGDNSVLECDESDVQMAACFGIANMHGIEKVEEKLDQLFHGEFKQSNPLNAGSMLLWTN